jgi:hypothetical protein
MLWDVDTAQLHVYMYIDIQDTCLGIRIPFQYFKVIDREIIISSDSWYAANQFITNDISYLHYIKPSCVSYT